MAVSPRGIPRFLPTLTEVVLAPVKTTVASVNEVAQDPVSDHSGIAQRVREMVEAEMGELLRDAVSLVLLEQVDAIAGRLQLEIEPLLRQSVADMVAQEIAARRHG